MESPYKTIGDFIRQHDKFTVLAHVRPDGDAYGSTLALALCLRAMGKDVLACNADGMIDRYRFLPGADTLVATPATDPDAGRKVIALDTADPIRLGKVFHSWQRTPDVNIDHHISNTKFAPLNCIIPTVPATAELLFELIQSEKFPLDAAIASNLFVGLSTDTGSFKHRQTTARSFEIAAALVRAGADPTDLAQQCYSSFELGRFLLLREALDDTKFLDNGAISYFHLTSEVYARTGTSSEDTEGLIESIQMVRTVEVAFMVEKTDGEFTRVSLRSRGKVDVQQIASRYGGGGHRLAAGIRSVLPQQELEEKLIADIRRALAA
jgi:bifunctional oligoribonuclease and PAP phosphatase NrnA